MPRRRGKGEGSIGRRKEDGLWYGRIDLGRDSTGKRRSRTVYSRTRGGAACRSRWIGSRPAYSSTSG